MKWLLRRLFSFIEKRLVAIDIESQPLECERCGYVKGPRTVAIPADRCPSCGFYWLWRS